jgi:hypothetical protein
MSLFDHLELFVHEVSYEALEAYVRAAAWDLRESPTDCRIWTKGSDPRAVHIPLGPEHASSRGLTAHWIESIAEAEHCHAIGVLYDLLPEDRRADLVRAVFPKLER